MDRLIDAFVDGIGNIERVKQRLREVNSEKLAIEEQLANLEAERIVAPHPNMAAEYRKGTRALHQALKSNNAPEIRREVISRVRALVDSIVLRQNKVGRGVEIEVIGRLARIIELATGRKPEEAVMMSDPRHG